MMPSANFGFELTMVASGKCFVVLLLCCASLLVFSIKTSHSTFGCAVDWCSRILGIELSEKLPHLPQR